MALDGIREPVASEWAFDPAGIHELYGRAGGQGVGGLGEIGGLGGREGPRATRDSPVEDCCLMIESADPNRPQPTPTNPNRQVIRGRVALAAARGAAVGADGGLCQGRALQLQV
jgi:hypothetical protein